MPFPELNDNKFEKNLTNASHSYREKVREQILNTPRNGRSNRRSIDLTMMDEAIIYRPSSRRSTDTLLFEQPRLKSASRDRQIIRYNKYIPSKENQTAKSINEDPYSNQEIIGRPSSRESFCHDTPRLGSRSSRRQPFSMKEHSQIKSDNYLENTLTKSINFFDLDSSRSKDEHPPVPKPRQKDKIHFNKQNMFLNDNENLKIKRNMNSLNCRATTPRLENLRLNRYSTEQHIGKNVKDELDNKTNQSFTNDWVKTQKRTNLNLSSDESQILNTNEVRKKGILKRS